MRAEPISPERLAERVAELVAELVTEPATEPGAEPWTRVAIDGAPGSGTAELAAAVEALLAGRDDRSCGSRRATSCGRVPCGWSTGARIPTSSTPSGWTSRA